MPKKWEITKAIRASDLPAPSRLVMFVLADVAHVGTAEIPEKWTPSLAVLARETGLGRSTVAQHLAALEDVGWVVRERPSEVGMARGDRTRYRLLIPGDATVSIEDVEAPDDSSDLVQEPDHPSPAEELPPSRSRTKVVQELDGGSPGAGQPYKDSRSKSDQSDLFGAPPTASTPDGDEEPKTARDILAGFIDYCDNFGIEVRPLRGHYAKEIQNALDLKLKPRFIESVLGKMARDNVANHPSWLRNRLVEATQPGAERRSNGRQELPSHEDIETAWKGLKTA